MTSFSSTVLARRSASFCRALALAACLLVYLFLWRTKWGFEIRATGSNPSAAEYGGISLRRQIVLAQMQRCAGERGEIGAIVNNKDGVRLAAQFGDAF